MERVVKIQVQDGIKPPSRSVREKISQVVEALRTQGIVGKGNDEITVNLASNPTLPPGAIGSRVTVVDIYRDNDGGFDTTEATYRVNSS